MGAAACRAFNLQGSRREHLEQGGRSSVDTTRFRHAPDTWEQSEVLGLQLQRVSAPCAIGLAPPSLAVCDCGGKEVIASKDYRIVGRGWQLDQARLLPMQFGVFF